MHKVTITLIHGEPLRFNVEVPEWRLLGLEADIEKAQSRNVLALVLDGKLVMIPYTNIRSIEIDPAPPELPKHIFRGTKN